MTLSNDDLAKRFANGKTSGKSSRMFIAGDTVYSYGRHFPIAKRVKLNGIDYLFNTNSYSSSTATHKNCVLGAIKGKGTVLHVKNCNIRFSKIQAEENKEEIKELQGKIKRARKERIKEGYRNRIRFLEKQNILLKGTETVHRLENNY